VPKSDVIKDIISKIEEEITGVQHEIDELEKRMKRIHQRRVLNSIRRGENGDIVNMLFATVAYK
jgi:prefoldin subunit 5